MKHFETDKNDSDLDAVFKLAQTQLPAPRSDLMATILADAQSVLDSTEPEHEKTTAPMPSWWQRLLGDIGGWPVVTGMATAGVFGLVVGLYGDTMLGGIIPEFQSTTEIIDPFVGFDLSYLEG